MKNILLNLNMEQILLIDTVLFYTALTLMVAAVVVGILLKKYPEVSFTLLLAGFVTAFSSFPYAMVVSNAINSNLENHKALVLITGSDKIKLYSWNKVKIPSSSTRINSNTTIDKPTQIKIDSKYLGYFNCRKSLKECIKELNEMPQGAKI